MLRAYEKITGKESHGHSFLKVRNYENPGKIIYLDYSILFLRQKKANLEMVQ